jgi:hypothetical protein
MPASNTIWTEEAKQALKSAVRKWSCVDFVTNWCQVAKEMREKFHFDVNENACRRQLCRTEDESSIKRARTFFIDSLTENDADFFEIFSHVNATKHFSFSNFSIQNIQIIFNSDLLEDFERESVKESKLLLHGTKQRIVSKICSEGFRVRTKGTFGGGIYFTDEAEKALQYCDAGSMTKQLLVCEVKLGKRLLKNNRCPNMNSVCLRERGCDSIMGVKATELTGEGFTHNEYAVYKSQKCLPKYVVHLSC